MLQHFVDRRSYAPGEVIIRQGDRGNAFFLIESGSVEVIRAPQKGRSRVLGRIGAGGIFGEMAIIDDRPRMATVTAVEATTCRVFPREFLEKKIARSDRLVRAIIKIFVEHIRSITDLQTQEIERGAVDAEAVLSEAE